VDAIRTLGGAAKEAAAGTHPRSAVRVFSNESYFPSEQEVYGSALNERHQATFGCRLQDQVPTSPLRVGERPTVAPNGRCRAGRDHSPTAQIRATRELISSLCEPFTSANLIEQNAL